MIVQKTETEMLSFFTLEWAFYIHTKASIVFLIQVTLCVSFVIF